MILSENHFNDKIMILMSFDKQQKSSIELLPVQNEAEILDKVFYSLQRLLYLPWVI